MKIVSSNKDELIKLFIAGKLIAHAIKNELVRVGDRYTLSTLFNLQIEDFIEYFDWNGFPPIDESQRYISPQQSDLQTRWVLEDGEYCAVFYERGTTTTEFATPSRTEFQAYWNKHRLETYTFQLSYPRSG